MTAKVATNGDCNKAENPNKCKYSHYPQCHHTRHSQSDHMRAAECFQDVRVRRTVHVWISTESSEFTIIIHRDYRILLSDTL